MRTAGLAIHQFRFEQRVFWRNPASLFFTVAFPIILLVIFGTIFGSSAIRGHGGIEATEYYVPAIISLAVISATMQSLAMSLVIARESGRLKRGRGTPMPSWALIAGRVGNAAIVSVLMLAALAVIGRLLFSVAIPWERLPAIALVLLIGAAAFACLGIALSIAVPSQDAAAPVVNAVLLPLYFLSGIFIPDQELSGGIISLSEVFPVRHFFQAMLDAYIPTTGAIDPVNLIVVAAWGLGALAVGVRWFRWSPRRG